MLTVHMPTVNVLTTAGLPLQVGFVQAVMVDACVRHGSVSASNASASTAFIGC